MHCVLVHPLVPSGPPAPLLMSSALTCPPASGWLEKAEPKVRPFPLESLMGWVLSRCHHPWTVTAAELLSTPARRANMANTFLRIIFFVQVCFLSPVKSAGSLSGLNRLAI